MAELGAGMEAEDKAVKVYALLQAYNYEGYDVPIIFSSLEKAIAYAKSDEISFIVDDVEIHEIELDEPERTKEVWSRWRENRKAPVP